MARKASGETDSTAHLGFEAKRLHPDGALSAVQTGSGRIHRRA
jgi:hypothetical protein